MTLYLEQLLDNLQNLPADFQRNLRLLRELDERSMKHLERIDVLAKHYIEAAKTASGKKLQALYNEIKELFHKTKSLGDEKVQLSNQTYEMIDRHIRRLDGDMARYENEIKQKVAPGTSAAENGNYQIPKKEFVKQSGRPSRKRPLTSAQDQAKTKSKRRRLTTAAETPAHNIKEKEKQIPEATSKAAAGPLTGLTDISDMPVDPHEPVYCICRQVSFGEMIACDNPNCPVEWFHLPCVGLTTAPKGKWFCPPCVALKKQKAAHFIDGTK